MFRAMDNKEEVVSPSYLNHWIIDGQSYFYGGAGWGSMTNKRVKNYAVKRALYSKINKCSRKIAQGLPSTGIRK